MCMKKILFFTGSFDEISVTRDFSHYLFKRGRVGPYLYVNTRRREMNKIGYIVCIVMQKLA